MLTRIRLSIQFTLVININFLLLVSVLFWSIIIQGLFGLIHHVKVSYLTYKTTLHYAAWDNTSFKKSA